MNKREFEDELEKEQDLPIDPRLAIQTSYGTIRYLIDAIVELVTNSDDSYKRLEQECKEVEGKIIIQTRRLKYSKCEKLEAIDFAEGMDKEQLKKALKFAGEASGFEKGKSVRGFFGRGLKEAILALGKGEIYTIKDDKLSKAILWKEGNRPKYRPPKESHTPSKEEREEVGIIEGNGTVVSITVTNEKIKCPDYKTFLPQVINHYALRDINSAVNRKVILRFESPEKKGLKIEKPILYKMPKGEKILEQSIKIPTYGDNVEIKIYESGEELESPYNCPFARAGLLIKTSGAILDNQLFKYEHERAGCFFFGEVMWTDLAERLRKGESLLDLNRVGIEWKHKVCQSLQNEIAKILEPFFEKKKKQIEVKIPVAPSEKTSKLNRNLCSLLNRLAKKHFSESPSGDELTEGEETKIKTLTIKPPYANIEINKQRYFSVYAPINILDTAHGYYQNKVSSNNIHIQVLDPVVKLNPHLKYSNIYYGRFRVIGRLDKEEATITYTLGEHTATATVRVAPPGKIGKRKEGPKGGFFREIKPHPDENPGQRARYDKNDRIIWIYVKFPGVKKYFEDNLNLKSDESKPMYAELVGEAFCEFTARYDVDQGRPPEMGDPINAYTIAMDNSQKEYLYLIHEAVLKHKL